MGYFLDVLGQGGQLSLTSAVVEEQQNREDGEACDGGDQVSQLGLEQRVLIPAGPVDEPHREHVDAVGEENQETAYDDNALQEAAHGTADGILGHNQSFLKSAL